MRALGYIALIFVSLSVAIWIALCVFAIGMSIYLGSHITETVVGAGVNLFFAGLLVMAVRWGFKRLRGSAGQ